ncbi:MAG: DUF6328 family protein [Actinomycetota bacterium]
MAGSSGKSSGKSEHSQDRELLELLNELRVALPGVQVLFAFLLTVPFSQGFASITSTQKAVYFAAFLSTATASALLIAPTAIHRMQWRERDKEALLQISNVLAIAGTAFLATAIVCVTWVITDVIYGGGLTPLVTGITAGVFALLWFVLPLYRRFVAS